MVAKINRVTVYVDGFNLYFGMIQSGYDYCKWLDVNKLINGSLSANQQLTEIKYFTSRVTNNPGKQRRQNLYLEALELTGLKLIYGLYKAKDVECNNCGHIWQVSNEKMTDVNIATHLLVDAFQDNMIQLFLFQAIVIWYLQSRLFTKTSRQKPSLYFSLLQDIIIPLLLRQEAQ